MYTNHDKKQPDTVCDPCSVEYGNTGKPPYIAWDKGVCGVCYQHTMITKPSDVGYLNMTWRSHGKQAA